MTKIQTRYNYVRTCRRKSGLSQRELALVLGYRDQWQVSRHERSQSRPTLRTALAYEVVFRVPTAQIFVDLLKAIEQSVEGNLAALELRLQRRSGDKRHARLTAQKLQWLAERRKP